MEDTGYQDMVYGRDGISDVYSMTYVRIRQWQKIAAELRGHLATLLISMQLATMFLGNAFYSPDFSNCYTPSLRLAK